MSKFDYKVKHPGWTIKFADGTWLTHAHGWCAEDSPYFADTFSSKEEAEDLIKEEKWDDAEVVVAWEPKIARLLGEIHDLKQANTFDPSKLQDLKWNLKELKSNLEDIITDLDKA